MGSEQHVALADSEPYRLPLTVRDFLILDEAGAFDGIGRVELIEGEIFKIAPLHRPHARIVMILSGLIDAAVERLGGGVEALSEPSAELDANNLPQAGIVIADIADEDFVTARTARLLVEVSATSLKHHLGPKLRLYPAPAAGILGRRYRRPPHHPLSRAHRRSLC